MILYYIIYYIILYILLYFMYNIFIYTHYFFEEDFKWIGTQEWLQSDRFVVEHEPNWAQVSSGQRRTWNSCHNDWRTVRWRERKPWKRPMKIPGFAWFLCGESIGVILQLLNCPIAESHCFNVHVFVCLKIGYPQFRRHFPCSMAIYWGKKTGKTDVFSAFSDIAMCGFP